MTRVVITGMGAVTPIGNDVNEYSDNLFQGKLGIAPITKFDVTETGVTNAGEVKDFDATLRVGKKAAKRMDLFSQYAVDSALQAVKQAQITSENTAAKDLGVIFSSGIGGLTTIQEQVIKMHEKGPKRVSPMFVLTAIVNMAADNIALRIGAKNICTSAVTACASGTNAIGEAYRQIKEGRAKVMVAGGAEASVNAHGTATKANDAAEAKAINLVFGEDSRVLVGSTKAMTGHLLGAAGAIEAIAVVEKKKKGRSPVNIGMTEQDKECKVNVVTQAKTHPEKLEYALSNSLGFGGHNAVLAFRKWS